MVSSRKLRSPTHAYRTPLSGRFRQTTSKLDLIEVGLAADKHPQQFTVTIPGFNRNTIPGVITRRLPMSAFVGKRTLALASDCVAQDAIDDVRDEVSVATVSIAGGLAWQPLMDTIGDQLLVGFGSFENLGQLEEALYNALERDGPSEIVHTGPLSLTGEQLASYLGVLASVAEEEPLKVSFVDAAVGAVLTRSYR